MNDDDLSSAGDEFDGLTARLDDFGRHPAAPAVRSQHLTEMAAVTSRPRGVWASKLRVGAAFFAGLLIGGSGLAAAGALPDQAQDVAHDVFGAVGVNVPEGRNTADCPEGQTFKNHGQYVSSVAKTGGDTSAAAKSDCGKPLGAGSDADVDDDADGDEPGARGADNPCRPPWAGGKPAWAGIKDPAERKAARDAAKAAWVPPAGCEDEAEVDDAEESEEPATDEVEEPDSSDEGDEENGPPEGVPPVDPAPEGDPAPDGQQGHEGGNDLQEDEESVDNDPEDPQTP